MLNWLDNVEEIKLIREADDWVYDCTFRCCCAVIIDLDGFVDDPYFCSAHRRDWFNASAH